MRSCSSLLRNSFVRIFCYQLPLEPPPPKLPPPPLNPLNPPPEEPELPDDHPPLLPHPPTNGPPKLEYPYPRRRLVARMIMRITITTMIRKRILPPPGSLDSVLSALVLPSPLYSPRIAL